MTMKTVIGLNSDASIVGSVVGASVDAINNILAGKSNLYINIFKFVFLHEVTKLKKVTTRVEEWILGG